MAQIYSYAEAVESLRLWSDALTAASTGQSYSIGGRTLTRQDITEIRAEIQRWHNVVTAMEARAQGNSRPLGSIASFPAPGSGAGGLLPQDLWERW